MRAMQRRSSARPAATAGKISRPPSRVSLALAEDALKRKARSREYAPVRFAFVDAGQGTDLPPLARMLRGGQGGMVRLRLYLSLLWVANRGTIDTAATTWARLMDLDEPETNGARRVSDALRWLSENQMVKIEPRKGRPPIVTVLQDDGTGDPYQPPWQAREALKGKARVSELGDTHLYFQVPSTFWTKGWITQLSGAGLAMLLILMRLTSNERDTWVWISPSQALARFGVSDDTRSRGARELERYKLINLKRKPVDRENFDWTRVRNTYWVNREVLASAPGEVSDELFENDSPGLVPRLS
jgi:hypothetical protein